jgi:hypothetical protein
MFTTMVYWFSVDVGEHAFYALVERPVIEDVVIDGKRRLTAREHKWLEAYVIARPTDADREMFRNDYDSHLRKLEQSGSALGLGNLRELLSSTRPDSSAAA